MAKKKRHRIWWMPVVGEEKARIQRRGVIGNTEKEEYPMLFDNREQAYAHAFANRFEVIRENGEVVTDDSGIARLRNRGRITLIGFRGQKIDWKQALLVENVPADVKGEVIVLPYEHSAHPQNIEQVVEEPDEMYYKYVTSPMAKAGGIKIPKELLKYHADVIANQTVLSPPEQGASLEHPAELAAAEIDDRPELPAALRELGAGSTEAASGSGSTD